MKKQTISVDCIKYNFIGNQEVEIAENSMGYHDDMSISKKITLSDVDFCVIAIGKNAFSHGNLKSVIIPDAINSIGQFAFSFCSYLTSIKIPDLVTIIRECTFLECKSLTFIIIPKFVTLIEERAFSGCGDLKSIEIPDLVQYIETRAFYGCESLTSITCNAIIPPSLGNDVFLYVPKNIPLYVPKESMEVYKKAEQWKDFTIKSIK